jgi:hypothetical protein
MLVLLQLGGNDNITAGRENIVGIDEKDNEKN